MVNYHADIKMLKERSHSEPFLDSYYLSFLPLPPTRKILVSLSESVSIGEYMLTLHFERFAGNGAVEGVEFSSPWKAVVNFKNPKCNEVNSITP